jgi:hypothetical protein
VRTPGDVALERNREGSVRETVRMSSGPPQNASPALLRLGGELGDQTRLPDTGLAAEYDHAAVAGVGSRQLPVELGEE